jgi:hypothetical protein
MNEGGSSHEYNPYPQYDNVKIMYKKMRTRKGIIFMYLAIHFIILSIFIRYIPAYLLFVVYRIYTGTLSDIGRNSLELSLLFSCIGFILMLVAIYFFSKGKTEFDAGHQENVKISKRIALLYIPVYLVILLLWLYILYGEDTSGLIFFSSLVNFMVIIEGIILALLLFLPAKEIAGKTEKDLLFLFSIFIIIAPVLTGIYDMIKPYENSYVRIFHLTAVNITLSMIFLAIWSFASTGYLILLRRIIVLGPNLPPASSGFLSRSKMLSKKMDKLFANPVKALSIIIILALILGAAEGVTTRMEILDLDDDDSDRYDIEQSSSPQLLRGNLAFSDSVNEGDSKNYENEFNMHLMILHAELTWADEPYEQGRINQPDCFTIDVLYGNKTESGTEENPYNGNGNVVIDISLSEDEAVFVETVQIILTLDYAGDQTGPMGLENSPTTVEDSSNDFSLVIDYCCSLKE